MATPAKKNKTEEERLAKILFNNTDELVENFSSAIHRNKKVENDSQLAEDGISEAAWHDEDDNIEVGTALQIQGRNLPQGGVNDYKGQYASLVKHKYKLLVGTPEWAKLNRKLESDEDDEVLQSVGHIAKTTTTSLPKRTLEYKRLKTLNSETGNEGPVIKAIEFHPSSSVALVAGFSGIASLLTVDGKNNEKLHSVAFKRYPIHCARFANDGSEAYLGSNLSHFYIYDLMNANALRIPLPKDITKMTMFEISKCGRFIAIGGRFGEIHLMCAKTRELIQTLKQNGDVTAVMFDPDGTKLYGHSTHGHVTVWDISSRRVVHKWYDDGCITGSSMALSPSGDYFATGSAQGVVNIYKYKDISNSKAPAPQKMILNLTTGITGLKFNSTSEILALISAEVKNAIRLIHIPSFEVFQNFPGLQPNFAHCNNVSFSPHSGFMSFGNNKNRAYLFRLKHYRNY